MLQDVQLLPPAVERAGRGWLRDALYHKMARRTRWTRRGHDERTMIVGCRRF
jgi:hypothetical protein